MIRLFGLRDVLLVKQLQPQGVAFDLRWLLLHSTSPLQSALAGYLTRYQLGTITCVHEGRRDGQGLRGFVQVWPRPAQAEWDLVFLSPALERHENAADLWYRLLTYLSILGAEQGILKIWVRSAEDAEAEDVFRQAGFTVVMREELFVLRQEAKAASWPSGLRLLTPQDLHALEELYRQAVPQFVQQVEERPPHLSLARYRLPLGAHRGQEYIWVEGGKALAYMGWYHSPRGAWMEIMARPEYRADALPYIRYVLALTGCSTARPVYCPVPDYDVGLSWLLRALGFEPCTRQVLLVRHTAARVPVRPKIVVPGLERSVNVHTSVCSLKTFGKEVCRLRTQGRVCR